MALNAVTSQQYLFLLGNSQVSSKDIQEILSNLEGRREPFDIRPSM